MLSEPLLALDDLYKPGFFTRIGLRYTNVIRRDAIGLQGVPWSRLLRREVLGELALPQFEKALDRVVNRAVVLKLPADEGKVVFRHGLANVAGTPPSENAYMIDFDFFKDARMETLDAKPTLDKFHEYAGHAFRWAITPELYNTLGPVDPVTGTAKPIPIDGD
jgi:uncharacterized protein (TIGR04255 family)